MPSVVTLTFLDGPMAGAKFGVDDRMVCIVGSAKDCGICIPDGADCGVSRYHCIFDMNPPEVYIRDLGSTNGTFVNGARIGVGERSPSSGTLKTQQVRILDHGDRLQIGTMSVQVAISAPGICRTCSSKIPPDKLSVNCRNDGSLVCESCYRKSALEAVKPVLEVEGDNVPKTVRIEQPQGQQQPQKKIEVKSYFKIQGFNIIRKLGAGAMGTVYLVEDGKSGGKVALKVLVPKVEATERSSSDFFREIDNTCSLNHPNIVRVFNSGYSTGVFYYTMEHVEFGDLQKFVMRNGGRLPPELAFEIIFQILDGLEYAHTAKIPYVKLKDGSVSSGTGLVHRDLKPENIFLCSTSPPQIKIADFGLSKAFDLSGLSGCTVTGTVGGTPYFMPRQQVLNFKYSKPDIDVWAAAATLYYMLTGKYPRDLDDNDDQYRKILETDPVPVRKRCPDIPRVIAETLDMAVYDGSDLFYKSAKAFKKALTAQ